MFRKSLRTNKRVSDRLCKLPVCVGLTTVWEYQAGAPKTLTATKCETTRFFGEKNAKFLARPALWGANVVEAKGDYGHRRAFAGARHRREYGALQRGGRDAAQETTGQRA